MYQIYVKKFRRKRRLTQKQLADICGLSESYICHLEKSNSKRDRTPSLQTVESLSIGLEICPRDMVSYPCIQCQLAEKCNKKEKDMRSIEEIEHEILEYYI